MDFTAVAGVHLNHYSENFCKGQTEDMTTDTICQGLLFKNVHFPFRRTLEKSSSYFVNSTDLVSIVLSGLTSGNKW